jgi:ornithine cyclodeaminase
VSNCDSLDAATSGVGLITLCTNSMEPFFSANMAATGAHINAVGAIVPKRREFFSDVFLRCSTIAVDTLTGVQNLSREFIDYFEEGEGAWCEVKSISQIINDGYTRANNVDLTLFKAMGMGISDIAVAHAIYKHCIGSDEVHRLPERQRQKLPLRILN